MQDSPLGVMSQVLLAEFVHEFLGGPYSPATLALRSTCRFLRASINGPQRATPTSVAKNAAVEGNTHLCLYLVEESEHRDKIDDYVVALAAAIHGRKRICISSVENKWPSILDASIHMDGLHEILFKACANEHRDMCDAIIGAIWNY